MVNFNELDNYKNFLDDNLLIASDSFELRKINGRYTLKIVEDKKIISSKKFELFKNKIAKYYLKGWVNEISSWT